MSPLVEQLGSLLMLIESINSSKPVKIRFNDKEVLTGIYKLPVEGSVQVTLLGLIGDTIVDKQFHGGLDQAIYLYHKEDYDWWSNELGKNISYGTFGENLTISGLDDISWVIGDRLKINELVLEITAPRIPCFKLGVRMQDNAFAMKFAKAARPGAYARVIKEGKIKVGDTIEIEKTEIDYAEVKEVFTEWHNKNKSLSILKKALNSPIASVHKEKIKSWYNELVR